MAKWIKGSWYEFDVSDTWIDLALINAEKGTAILVVGKPLARHNPDEYEVIINGDMMSVFEEYNIVEVVLVEDRRIKLKLVRGQDVVKIILEQEYYDSIKNICGVDDIIDCIGRDVLLEFTGPREIKAMYRKGAEEGSTGIEIRHSY